MLPWDVQVLSNMPLQEAWDMQERLRAEIIAGSSQRHLLLVEHPHTLTLGRGEKGQNLHQSQQWFTAQGFDVVTLNRGGEVTYHGPGQLVAYPVFDLQQNKLGIKDYVCLLEKSMLDTLAHFGLQGHRLEGHPGIYVDGKKIGSVGIHVRKFVTIHGLALNITTDLNCFSQFTPCGIPNIQMTTLAHEGIATTMTEAISVFQNIFLSQFSI
ncbi:MAG: lipoyl(octanoyl) transferase LipB [Bdellovibrionota bacterium]